MQAALSTVDERHTIVVIFLLRSDARTKQRYSVGVGKGGLPFLGTGLLCPLTETKSSLMKIQKKEKEMSHKSLYHEYRNLYFEILLFFLHNS